VLAVGLAVGGGVLTERPGAGAFFWTGGQAPMGGRGRRQVRTDFARSAFAVSGGHGAVRAGGGAANSELIMPKFTEGPTGAEDGCGRVA
jgi:hypothetical protein